jgi:4-hydroxybenzoate polyprenyltransferase
VNRLPTIFASLARLHIVAVAMGASLAFGWLFFERRDFLLMGVVGLDWFLVNFLNRAADVEEDLENEIQSAKVAQKHQRLIIRLGVGLLLISLLLTHLWSPALTPWRLAFHTLGFFYNWPLLPGKKRIKSLYFFKNTASATGFLITLFGFHHARMQSGESFVAPGFEGLGVAAFILFFFLFELSYEVVYDMRDREGDAAVGARTFAVVHGQRGALFIVDGLLISSAILLLTSYLMGFVPWRAAIMAVAPIISGIWVHRAVKRGITSQDCIGLTWTGALLLVVYQLWIEFDLPGASWG